MNQKQISFVVSDKGIKTCKIDAQYLHSRYNPHQEALRNIQVQLTNYKDTTTNNNIVLIVGAAMGYETSAVQEILPTSIIISIFFHSTLFELCTSTNKILYNQPMSSDMINTLRSILRTVTNYTTNQAIVIYWPPSANIWPTHTVQCIKEIREYLAIHYAEMRTLKHFISQWIRNACFHYLHLENWVLPNIGDKNIVIVAAGPDLNRQIAELQKKRKEYTLIGVSSALKCLFSHHLYPDIIVHQDSSYYASRYLIDFPPHYTPYFALPLHASRSTKIRECPCIILNTYQETEHLLNVSNPTLNISPHGTVLGTALELGWKLTKNQVILVGFDLSMDSSGSHCIPHLSSDIYSISKLNPLETQNLKKFFKGNFKLKQKRYNTQLRQDESLKIYSDWFRNWKHPWKTSRCSILSSIDVPHHQGIKKINEIPTNTTSHIQEIRYTEYTQQSSKIKTKTLMSLSERWLKIWNNIEQNEHYTNKEEPLLNTLRTLQANLSYDEFTTLIHSIQANTRSII